MEISPLIHRPCAKACGGGCVGGGGSYAGILGPDCTIPLHADPRGVWALASSLIEWAEESTSRCHFELHSVPNLDLEAWELITAALGKFMGMTILQRC